MAKHIFANLAPFGWVDLTEDKDCQVSREFLSPNSWYKEGGPLDSISKAGFPDNLVDYPFVNLSYKGNDYRVSPLDFQIVVKD